jgi:cystathionine beta-synthase
MRLADISQVPVMENGHCVGVLDESDLLLAVHEDEARFRAPVRTAMSSRLETIAHDESIDRLYSILDRGLVALVLNGDHFLGLITRSDLLSYLRLRVQ